MISTVMLPFRMLLLAVAPAAAHPREARLDLGFSHWFGPTSGSPDGLTTPAVSLAVQPGPSWLEIAARYTLSVPAVAGARGSAVGIGFASLAPLGRHTVRDEHGDVVLCGGPLVLHPRLAVGPALGVQGVYYTLPGYAGSFLDDLQREAQIDLGVTVAMRSPDL